MNDETTSNRTTVTLLAEDDPSHAQLIVHGLQKYDIDNVVHHVWDGEEALDYLFRRGRYADPQTSPRPDAILLDLRMPKADGLDVLKTIKESDTLQDIPVVVLTSSESEMDIARAYEHRANSYLVKPLDFAAFSRLMNDLASYWFGWNRIPGPLVQDEATS